MKENPALRKVRDNMKPGVISLHGFLGKDRRGLEEIIDHDAAELEKLGITGDEVADKLETIRNSALKGLGGFVPLSPGYEAKADSIRGKLPCPFSHAGVYQKTVTTLRHKESGREWLFTDLGIHMIREHGFFEGRGSIFRLEPEDFPDLLSI